MLNECNKEKDGYGAFAAEVHFSNDQIVTKYLQRHIFFVSSIYKEIFFFSKYACVLLMPK